jgi:hypothetical protein
MNYMNFIDEQMTKVWQITKSYDDVIGKVKDEYSKEYAMYGTIQVHLSDDKIEANKQTGRELVGKLIEERNAEVQKIFTETEERLAMEKKKAIQEYASAEPVPTEEDIRRVEHLKSEYKIIGNAVSMKFMDDMKFHVDNGTVWAYAYYLIAKDSDSADSNKSLLQDMFNTMFPQIQERADDLKTVEDAINLFKSQVILYQFSTNENISFAQSVSWKAALAETGHGTVELNQRQMFPYI